MRVRGDRRGAVFVEFLLAFLPVQIFFLCLIQSAILYTVRLVTEHAAITAARAAAVVLADKKDQKLYGNDDVHTMAEGTGGRREVIRNAAIMTMAPLILKGVVTSVDVFFPPADRPNGEQPNGTLKFQPMHENTVTKLRVRVEVDAACRIGFASQIVCNGWLQSIGGGQVNKLLLPTRKVKAEAIYPYQGAEYVY